MHVDEFDQLVTNTNKKCDRHEIEIIFRTVDKQGRGYLLFEDL